MDCAAALQGDAEMQFILGLKAFSEEKKDEATYWWKLAADNGDPKAQETLAEIIILEWVWRETTKKDCNSFIPPLSRATLTLK